MAGELTYQVGFEENAFDLSDYLTIIKRRRLQFILPAIVIFFSALSLALLLPAIYRSTAIILIEEQEIPQELVQSTITSFAAQQIQVISQRVMTIDNIYDVAKKYNLYEQGDESERLPKSKVALMFRENVNLDLISADVIDPRSGRPGQATIAFSLSFDDSSPSATQKVANELVSLYLDENLRTRTVKAAGASEFLKAEATALDLELVEREEKLAVFKAANEGALPELYQFNLSIVDRSERELSEIGLRIQQLEKNQIELSAQMLQMSPSAPVVLPSGEAVLSDTDRLKSLQSEYLRKSAQYNDNHPDVVRLKREIRSLKAQTGLGQNSEDLAKDLRQQRDTLSELQASYTADHPKVVKQKNVVAVLESELANAGSQGAARVTSTPDNPAYVLLDTQLKATRSEIQSLQAKRIELVQKIAKYEDLIRLAPAVEKDYQALLRDYEGTQFKYQEIKSKQRQADVARNLEQGRKGERFTLIEPPVVPLEPVKPNRPALILLGLVLGLAAGVGLVVLSEASDNGIYGEKALTRIMGAAPLVVIPYLESSADQGGKKVARKWGWVAVPAALVVALLTIHFLYKPLDVLWFVLLRKLGLG